MSVGKDMTFHFPHEVRCQHPWNIPHDYNFNTVDKRNFFPNRLVLIPSVITAFISKWLGNKAIDLLLCTPLLKDKQSIIEY